MSNKHIGAFIRFSGIGMDIVSNSTATKGNIETDSTAKAAAGGWHEAAGLTLALGRPADNKTGSYTGPPNMGHVSFVLNDPSLASQIFQLAADGRHTTIEVHLPNPQGATFGGVGTTASSQTKAVDFGFVIQGAMLSASIQGDAIQIDASFERGRIDMRYRMRDGTNKKTSNVEAAEAFLETYTRAEVKDARAIPKQMAI